MKVYGHLRDQHLTNMAQKVVFSEGTETVSAAAPVESEKSGSTIKTTAQARAQYFYPWWASKNPAKIFWGQANEPVQIVPPAKYLESAKWLPRGQTPVLEFDFNWKKLSVIGEITVWNFYFQFYPGAIKSLQVIAFLKHLQKQLPGKLVGIWDEPRFTAAAWCRHTLKAFKERFTPPHSRPTRPNSIPSNMSGATLSNTPRPPRCARSPPTAKHPPPSQTDSRFLAASRIVVKYSLYYAEVNSASSRAPAARRG